MISVLYFIRKINAQYSNKTNNIANNGSNMDECTVLGPKIFILAGWCSVDHHSTEYLIIGRLMEPMTAIIEETLIENSWFEISFKDRI